MTDIFFRADKLKILHISKRMMEDKKKYEINTAPGVSSSSSLCCIQLLIQYHMPVGTSQPKTNELVLHAPQYMCYNYDMWATWCLKLLLIRLFAQRPVPIQANIKENIKDAGPLSRCGILLTFTTRNADSASWAAMQYYPSITME